jgi:purine nucleoside permease
MVLRLFAALLLLDCLSAQAELIRPKVVIVTMFEVGKDTGDTPGEFQLWVERMHLDRVITVPAAYHDTRLSTDGAVLAIVTGMGNTRAAASIMALGLDPRFDLQKSYWLVAGIAGIDPADGSLGSAVWANYVVDGDLAHELDAREIPSDWPTGYVPMNRSKPYQPPAPGLPDSSGSCYTLNTGLVEWAFQNTRDLPRTDNEQMKIRRAKFVGQPAAQRPPFVLKGDNLAASTFWHGAKMNAWANEWVRYYTQGSGNYVTTAMEDAGTLHALTALSHAGRVDVNRVLVLRTASNYDMQSPDMTAAESLGAENAGLSGYLPSLESAYQVGRKIVDTLVNDWETYEGKIPGPARL